MNITSPTVELPRLDVRLTRKELGALFGVSEVTIKRVSSLKPERINARVLRYTIRDIHRMIDAGYHPDIAKAQSLQIPLPEITALNRAAKPIGSLPEAPVEELAEVKLLVELMRSHLKREPGARAVFLHFVGQVLTEDTMV